MEKIEIMGELLFTLTSKQQWVNRVPNCLPDATRSGERLIWVDKNGCVFESGADFMEAEIQCTYPCKVYRPYSVTSAKGLKIEKSAPEQEWIRTDLKLPEEKTTVLLEGTFFPGEGFFICGDKLSPEKYCISNNQPKTKAKSEQHDNHL